jgi:hypothetical protein
MLYPSRIYILNLDQCKAHTNTNMVDRVAVTPCLEELELPKMTKFDPKGEYDIMKHELTESQLMIARQHSVKVKFAARGRAAALKATPKPTPESFGPPKSMVRPSELKGCGRSSLLSLSWTPEEFFADTTEYESGTIQEEEEDSYPESNDTSSLSTISISTASEDDIVLVSVHDKSVQDNPSASTSPVIIFYDDDDDALEPLEDLVGYFAGNR